MKSKIRLSKIDFTVISLVFCFYIFGLNYLHQDLHVILTSCNDDFFDADTSEIYQQIDGFYLNTDTMKHIIPYVFLFLLEKFRFLVLAEIQFFTKLTLFHVIAATNICLVYVLSRYSSLNTAPSLLIAVLFGTAFSQLTIGSFPETYSTTTLFALSYLVLYERYEFSSIRNDTLMRSIGSSVLGLCHFPLFMIGLFSRNLGDKIKLHSLLIPLFVGFVVSTSPMWGVSIISPNAASIIFDYTSKFASIYNLLKLSNWGDVISNLLIINFWSPDSYIKNLYGIRDINFATALFAVSVFVAICVLSLRANHTNKIQFIIGIVVISSQIIFYVFFAPKYSALFSITLLPLIVIIILLCAREELKSTMVIVLILLISIAPANILTIKSTPAEPLDGECYNWPIKTGLMRVF